LTDPAGPADLTPMFQVGGLAVVGALAGRTTLAVDHTYVSGGVNVG
jgi:hypothetical protein